MGEDSWEKKERFRKAYYPVRQALGRSSFVDVRPSRGQYTVHWLRFNNVSLVLGWRSQNMCAWPPPHGHGEMVSTGGPKRLHKLQEEDLRGD